MFDSNEVISDEIKTDLINEESCNDLKKHSIDKYNN
jgi:hypothetical protein